MTRVLRAARRFTASTSVCREAGIVAVSGGADSAALLRALAACRTGPLTVAHVNHHLRGEESDADEAFVRELAAKLELPCRVKSVDVAALGGNLESTARRVRYEFFHELATEVNAAWIATGHTADDQAETVLHRIVRGTGIQGLRGIAARSQESEVRSQFRKNTEASALTPDLRLPTPASVIRPLLTVTRADIVAHLAELQQTFREDSSNADSRFTRNRIRHELLPLLRTFNQDVVTALVRLAEHASDAHSIITEKAAEVLAKAERPRVGTTIILDAVDIGTSRAVIRSVLRLVWERETWTQEQMDAEAWDRACAVACRELPACDFPGGISMRHTGRVVQIVSRK